MTLLDWSLLLGACIGAIGAGVSLWFSSRYQ